MAPRRRVGSRVQTRARPVHYSLTPTDDRRFILLRRLTVKNLNPRISAAIFSVLLPVASLGAPVVNSAEIEAGLEGGWLGALHYKDYQSNRMFDLPIYTQIMAIGDHRTFVRKSRFDDGPKRKVYITTLTQFSSAGDKVFYASSRVGNDFEITTDDVVVESYQDATHWRELYQRVDIDGDQKSNIRVQVTRDGDKLISEKQVKGIDEPADAFKFRNQSELHLMPTCDETGTLSSIGTPLGGHR